MDFELGDSFSTVQLRARAVASSVLAPRAAETDRDAVFPSRQIQALASEGFLAMLVPRGQGGTDMGAVAYSLVVTELARACPSTAVTMAVTNMVCDAICAFGSREQAQHFVPGLASAELEAGSFCLSEPGAGSDAASLSMVARKDGDRYVLSGAKSWITSGDRAGVYLVMARTGHAGPSGISAFLVERGTPGLVVGKHEDKLGVRGSSTVTLSFDQVVVPASARLGAEGIGFKIAMRALDGGRIGVASQAIGIGLSAFEEAQKYVRSESLHNPPLRSRQAVQWKLSDMATELDAARLLALRAASLKDQQRPFSREASMAKVFCTEAANRATQEALSIVGEAGSGDGSPVARAFRDCRVTTIYEGTSEIQRHVIAREILKDAVPY